MAQNFGVSLLALALCLSSPVALAAAGDEPFFSYRLVDEHHEPRGVFWRPIFSFVLPGLDQWVEGQYRSAAVYSGYALTGLAVAGSATRRTSSSSSTATSDSDELYEDDARKLAWGLQSYMAAGFVSSFHAFRKAAETQKAQGKYLFLKHEETTGDLLIAPLRLDYLLKPSVFIPLGLLAGLLAVDHGNDKFVWTGNDVIFGTGVSLNAGIGEEAFFRGYMMPYLRQAWDSNWWSNVGTSTAFAAAHLGSNKFPWQQFLAGLYLGWRTQKNEWRMSEAVFIHTWWDIIILTANLAHNRGRNVYMPIIRAEF